MNRCKIEFNNYDEKKQCLDKDIVLTALKTDNEHLITMLNKKILTPYQKKINLIEHMINKLLLKNTFNIVDDIFNFFNLISPMSNQYKLGSLKFNNKIVDNYLFIHNSVLKKNITDSFECFIDLICKHFENIEFHFYDLRNTRFNKTLDIIFVFKIDKDNIGLVKK